MALNWMTLFVYAFNNVKTYVILIGFFNISLWQWRLITMTCNSIIQPYYDSHLTRFDVITVSEKSIRFQSNGLIAALYQSLHTNEQLFKSLMDKNLNAGTNAAHRFHNSLSASSVSSLGTGRTTYLGRWLHFFELDSISSIGKSTLLAIGSLVRISSSIFTLPDDTTAPLPLPLAGTSAWGATTAFGSGMYSDYKIYETRGISSSHRCR